MGDKGVHIFPLSISPKENVITWLEFELVYYNVTVLHISHYTTMTPPKELVSNNIEFENSTFIREPHDYRIHCKLDNPSDVEPEIWNNRMFV